MPTKKKSFSYGKRKRRKSKRSKNKEARRKERYLVCPYCNAEYTSSKDLIKLGTGTIFTSKDRRIYGCYNCKKILGIGSRSTGGSS